MKDRQIKTNKETIILLPKLNTNYEAIIFEVPFFMIYLIET